ncbi:uncharacterized protein LOC142144052 [Mixophyes fleayi]|uniref:uncharacterized protein LOC142144052 n=1 Tax=Mixophyes fleayi TaxID=3061075 RepID=UPI003F4E00CC
MQHPAATTLANFDNSHLFLPLTTNPLDPSIRYLLCPATGHLYCLQTGSLYQVTSPTIALPSNIRRSLQRANISLPLLLSNPYTYTEQISSINPMKNPDPSMQGSTAPIIPGIQANEPPNIECKSDLPPQGNPYAPQNDFAPTTKKSKRERKEFLKSMQDKLLPTQTNSASLSPTIPLPNNIQFSLPRREICFPSRLSTPTPCKKKVSSINTKSNADPSIHGSSAPITPDTQGNEPPNIKCKSDLPPQGNPSSQSKINSTTCPQSTCLPTTKKSKREKKKLMKDIQDKLIPSLYNSASPAPTIPLSTNIPFSLQRRDICFPSYLRHPNPCTKQVSSINPQKNPDPSIQGSTAPIIPGTQARKPPNIKCKSDLPPQSNPSSQSKINSSTCPQYDSTQNTNKTKKEKKKHIKNIQIKPMPSQDNSASLKKKSASCNQGKAIVPTQVKPSKSFKNICPQNSNTTLASITQIKPASHSKSISTNASQSKSNTCSQYKPFVNHKNKSYRYCTMALDPMHKLIRPMQNIFDHLFSQIKSFPLNLRKFPRCISDTPVELCPLSEPMDKCTLQPPNKPSLKFSTDDYVMMVDDFKKRVAKRKKFVQVSRRVNNTSIWRFLVPFNRRPHPQKLLQHHRTETIWASQCKNCIMASSVHEIIHSRFTQSKNEHMPLSQLRAMLSSGNRKLRTDQEWIRQMEEEAIHKYTKLNLEKYNRKLKVEDHDVVSHMEKSWLVCFGRSVINKSKKDSWPLLVKCLYKHPDSTLRQACKHRSFCLTWNETSYTLRRDHAYYTQIQCHMAITNTLYAELLVHTNKETTIVSVFFDYDFWEQTEAKLEVFFTENVLPYLRKSKVEPNLIRDSFESQSINNSQE